MSEIKLPLIFGPQEVYEERAKLLNEAVKPPHISYRRDNEGSWLVQDANNKPLFRVAFQGKAKRGEAYNAPDPEGFALAQLLVDLLTKHLSTESPR